MLSNGRFFLSGWNALGGSVDHEVSPGLWDHTNGQNPAGYNGNITQLPQGTPVRFTREYNSSVLFPRFLGTSDTVVRAGGKVLGVSSDFVEQCQPLSQTTGQSWSALPPLDSPRTEANLVILPDGSLLLLNGANETASGSTPAKIPELFKDGAWHPQSEETSPRGYHATALLLPDGSVLSAGAEDRTWDFQIYSPAYLTQDLGTRPGVLGVQAPRDASNTAYRLAHNQAYTVQVEPLPLGTTIDRAVLIAPGAVTHHSDMHQRSVEVAFKAMGSDGNWELKTPLDKKIAPGGYYMLFLLTNHGIPSEATWVQLL